KPGATGRLSLLLLRFIISTTGDDVAKTTLEFFTQFGLGFGESRDGRFIRCVMTRDEPGISIICDRLRARVDLWFRWGLLVRLGYRLLSRRHWLLGCCGLVSRWLLAGLPWVLVGHPVIFWWAPIGYRWLFSILGLPRRLVLLVPGLLWLPPGLVWPARAPTGHAGGRWLYGCLLCRSIRFVLGGRG